MKGIAVSVAILFLGNFCIENHILTLSEHAPRGQIVSVDETPAVKENVQAYFAHLHSSSSMPFSPPAKLPVFSATVSQVLTSFASAIAKGPVFLRFDPIQLIYPYSAMMRFNPAFQADPRDVITPDTYRHDFGFLMEVFSMEKRGLLPKDTIRRVKKFNWPLDFFDHEFGYSLGYENYVRAFLKGTPLELVDTHFVYFIDLKALKHAAQSMKRVALTSN